MYPAPVVQLGGVPHLGHVVQVPGVFRLLVAMGVAHAADGVADVLADQPVLVFQLILVDVHGVAEVALDVAHGLVDGAIVVHVGVVGHHRVGHAVGELMGQHVQALGKAVGAAGQEQLPAVVFARVGGVVDGLVVLVAEVLQDQDRRLQAVAALPADGFVIIPGAAVVVQRHQAVFVPVVIVFGGLQHHIAAVVQELPAIGHGDAPLDVAQVGHAGAAVAHQLEADFTLGAVGEGHRAGVIHRLHEFKHVGSVVAGGADLVAGDDRGQAVQVSAVHVHVVGQVGQLGAPVEVGGGVVGVDRPDEAVLLLFLLGIHVDLQVYGQHDPGGMALQHLQGLALGLLHMGGHQRLGPGGVDACGVVGLGQLGFDATHQAQHRAAGVGDDLHRAAGDGHAVVHLLEHVIAVAVGIGEGAPGLEHGPLVATHQGNHGVHDPGGVLDIGHRGVGTGAFHEGHAPVPGDDLRRAAVQPIQVLKGQRALGPGLDHRRLHGLGQGSRRTHRQDQSQQHRQQAFQFLHKRFSFPHSNMRYEPFSVESMSPDADCAGFRTGGISPRPANDYSTGSVTYASLTGMPGRRKNPLLYYILSHISRIHAMIGLFFISYR